MSLNVPNAAPAQTEAAPVETTAAVAAPAPATEGGAAEAVAEAKPVAAGVKSKATKGTGDLIADTALNVENLTKTKALNLADNLFETVETSFFQLGGILKVIKDNTWYEGYADFDTFVMERFGFASRKAQYLMQIYTDLVTKSIPWAKVSHLGWTKLKELSPVLTAENLDDWVAKAEKLTVMELVAALKAKSAPETTTKATDEFVPFKLKVKPDQKTMLDAAIAKAKGVLNTEYDAVALENICAAYLADGSGKAAVVDTSSLDGFIKSVDFMTLLGRVAELNPEWDISVDKAAAPAAA
jgi:hypothetical protein